MPSDSDVSVSKIGSCWNLFLPIDPVPASRPRFTRSGRIYFGKRYTQFRKEAEALFQLCELPPCFPLNGMVIVTARFIVRPPKKTKRLHPRGDVDNYFKTLDVVNEIVWWDDDQIIWASMSKEFGDSPGIELEVTEVDHLPSPRAMSKLWK